MKKITILDAYDPYKEQFIPIKQAINQGLFNSSTYLYFNPLENQHYSITDAEKNGFLRLAIDQRPEALIVERIKVSQLVSLVSARDPENKERLVPISQAIYLGIIDNKSKVYVDSTEGKEIDLGDAFDSDLIQGNIVGEITEKVTETLTEQKSPDNPESIGLLKKIETHTYGMGDQEPMELTRINGVFVFDRTKSMSINKMIKKYDDEITAGFISDLDSCRILDSKSKNTVIDFNDALEKNLVIMPDSLIFEQNVKYVLDLNTGNKFDFEAACEIGLIDVKNRTFFNTKLNKSISLFEALAKNYIVMKDELYTNYNQSEIDEENDNDDQSNTISYLDLRSMFDPSSGIQISVKQALELGILSKDKQFYVDLYSRKKMSLYEAVEKGLALLKPEKIKHKVNEGYQYLIINGVFDPIQNKEMSLAEAINSGFLDYSECEFHDPLTGQTMSLLDAYDKGYLKTRISDSNDFELNSKCDLTEFDQDLNNSKVEPEVDERESKAVVSRVSRADEQQTSQASSKLISKSYSVSPKRNSQTAKFRSASAYDVKSIDRLSTMTRKSVISKIKNKVLGKKPKYNHFNEYLIQESMKIFDTKSNKLYTLKEAIDKHLLKKDDRIIDTQKSKDFSVNESIQNGLIKFFHPLNNFEFKYDQSCSIFNDEFLLLVNYVIEPGTKRKIGLKSAFQNGLIDKQTSVYYKKKAIDLIKAIEKGYISCEIIDLNLLSSVIASNVFKYYKEEDKKEDIEEYNDHSALNPLPRPSPKLYANDQTDLDTSQNQTMLDYENFEQQVPKPLIKGLIPKDILEKSGIKDNPYRDYCISEVLDSDKNTFVSLKKAVFLQIFDLELNEYFDSSTGNSMSLLKAIQKGKIRIREHTNENGKGLYDYDEIDEDDHEPRLTSTMKTYESLLDEEIEMPKLDLTETVSISSTPTSTRLKTESDFDILKVLLYKKSTNSRYIRFDRVLKHDLYNPNDGMVRDIKDNVYYSFYDALKKGLFRINDSNVIFDELRIYVVDFVLVNSRKLSLDEAVQKKIIDKSRGIVKFLNQNYTYNEAFKNGYFEAKLITFNEIRWILDDYAKRKKEKSDKNLHKFAELYTPVSIAKTIGPNFGIFDSSTDSYVSIGEAYNTGILLNNPIRVKDVATNNYVLLKDAIIKGLISCEPKAIVDFKSSFLAHNRKSYIVDCVYDPRKNIKYSLTDAIKTGVFNNGTYKNFLEGKLLSLDEAIENGFIKAKLINFDLMESSFKRSLSDRYENTPPSSPPLPTKQSRGVLNDEEGNDIISSQSRRKSLDRRRKVSTAESNKSKMEPFSGRIVSVQDVISGKYLKVDDAVKYGLINFRDGNFKNSLTNETLNINNAMNRGFILVESNLNKLESKRRAQSVRSNRTINSTKNSIDFLDTSRIEIGPEFKILSVLDPIRKDYVSLNEAVEAGIFDINLTMYVDPRTNKKLTLVDAIDQNLIKIADKNFKPSFKLTVEENDKNFVKNIKTVSIRFIVDSFTQQIIPVNIADRKKLVNLENGTYIGYEKIIGLKEAYDKCLAFTCDDLDKVNSPRGKFKVVCVRKSTTGKNMSLKSALAKNWINLNRKVYIDKMINQEMPFSQAVDMDLLVLKSNYDENTKNPATISTIRSKSRDGYFNNNNTTSKIF